MFAFEQVIMFIQSVLHTVELARRPHIGEGAWCVIKAVERKSPKQQCILSRWSPCQSPPELSTVYSTESRFELPTGEQVIMFIQCSSIWLKKAVSFIALWRRRGLMAISASLLGEGSSDANYLLLGLPVTLTTLWLVYVHHGIIYTIIVHVLLFA